MTSKQVRKAYKAATKQPTMSRAERLKYEKEQQERIRKELEKEKAARKAKAAREKKKEKEAAEAEAKKKLGMPTIRVRPSQDTIAWFVRGKKRDSGGEVKDVIEEAEEPEEPEEPEEKAEQNGDEDVVEGVSEDFLDDLDVDETIDELLEDEEQPAQQQVKQAGAMEPQKDESSLEVETPEVDIPGADVEAELEAEIVPAVEPKQNDTPGYISAEELEAILDEDLELDLDFDDFADEPNLSIDQDKTHTPKPSPAPKQLTPKPRSPTPKTSPAPPSFAPPPSTQAILFNLDSFFPSASQQALELEDFSSPPRSPPKTHRSPAPAPPFLKPPTPTPKANPPTTAPKTKPPTPKAPSQHSQRQPSQHIPVARTPKRFFTSSGSTEQLSLALHRSRRTAELEEIRQRDRQRSEAGILLRESKRQYLQQERERRQKEAQEAQRLKEGEEQARRFKEREAQPQRLAKVTEDKENIIPKEIISASQETEYGGDWVDDAAFDLAF